MSEPDPRNTPYDYCEAGPVINPVHQPGAELEPNPQDMAPMSQDAERQLKPEFARRLDRLERMAEATMGIAANAPPPPVGSLTIIWAEEKAELHRRLEALELDVRDLQAKLQALLEAYRTNAAAPITAADEKLAALETRLKGLELSFIQATKGSIEGLGINPHLEEIIADRESIEGKALRFNPGYSAEGKIVRPEDQ